MGASGSAPQAFTGNPSIDGLFSGVKWNALTIDFNFPTSAAYYPPDYGGVNNEPAGFVAVSETFKSMVLNALNNQFAAVSNLTFTEVGASTSSNISAARTADLNGSSGFGYGPGSLARSGDVWFVSAMSGSPSVGDTEIHGRNTWRLVNHELGHAMGLKHPHHGSPLMPAAHDFNDYTVMSYRRYEGGPTENTNPETFGSPQTLMMYDIAALQAMYGANYNTNSGNSIYSWNPATGAMSVNGVADVAPGANRVYMTLWDGGGVDTYDLSAYSTNLSIDLNPGGRSIFADAQLAIVDDVPAPHTRKATGNVFNALLFNNDARSLIENAIGGSGNDTFIGNAADNTFTGGSGLDTVAFAGNRNLYTFTETNSYSVTGNAAGNDTLNSIERFRFSDIIVTDDRIGGTNTDGTIAVGGTATGNIQFIGDRDWFGTTLNAHQAYTLRLEGALTGLGTLSDPFLRLYDSGSTLIGSNDDVGSDLNSRLIYHATAAGNYFLGAAAFSTGLGTYTASMTPTTFQSAGSWTGAGHDPQGWYVGDFTGDGHDDIFRYNAGVSGAEVFASNGSSFGGGSNWTGAGNDAQGWYIGNFNGDNRDDILRHNAGVSGAEVFLSDGSAFVLAGSWTGAGNDPQGWYVGDFNGDNRDDIFRYNAGVSGAEVFLSNGMSFVFAGSWTGAGNDSQGWYVGDFNGDNRDDIFRYNGGVSGAEVFLSNGASFVFAGSWTGAGNQGRWYVGDFNGDGTDDIFRMVTGVSGADVFLSNGSAFVSAGNWTPAGNGSEPWYVGDFDGDGLADIFRYMPGVSGAEVFLI